MEKRTSIVGKVLTGVKPFGNKLYSFTLAFGDEDIQVILSKFLGQNERDTTPGHTLKLYGKIDKRTGIFYASEMIVNPPVESSNDEFFSRYGTRVQFHDRPY